MVVLIPLYSVPTNGLGKDACCKNHQLGSLTHVHASKKSNIGSASSLSSYAFNGCDDDESDLVEPGGGEKEDRDGGDNKVFPLVPLLSFDDEPGVAITSENIQEMLSIQGDRDRANYYTTTTDSSSSSQIDRKGLASIYLRYTCEVVALDTRDDLGYSLVLCLSGIT